MVALLGASSNQSMVFLFDATSTFDATSVCRAIAHPNAAHANAACHASWNWLRISFNQCIKHALDFYCTKRLHNHFQY